MDADIGTCKVHGRWYTQYVAEVPIKIFCNEPKPYIPKIDTKVKRCNKHDKELSEIFKVRG